MDEITIRTLNVKFQNLIKFVRYFNENFKIKFHKKAKKQTLFL